MLAAILVPDACRQAESSYCIRKRLARLLRYAIAVTLSCPRTEMKLRMSDVERDSARQTLFFGTAPYRKKSVVMDL
jgi:hypothetical protein